MDFWLTDDQQALGDMVSTFVADRFALEDLPDAEDAGTVMDREPLAHAGRPGCVLARRRWHGCA